MKTVVSSDERRLGDGILKFSIKNHLASFFVVDEDDEEKLPIVPS